MKSQRKNRSSRRLQYRHRKLTIEAMEARQLLAADVATFANGLLDQEPSRNEKAQTASASLHNPDEPFDVNLDGQVTGRDALAILNLLNPTTSVPGEGEADFQLRPDVNADGRVNAVDVQRMFQRLEAEGEGTPTVEFTFAVLDNAGQPIANNQVSVGDAFQVQVFVRDTRGFNAAGVNAAFLDLEFDNAEAFDVSVGEVQQFQFFFDELDTSDTTSSFTLGFQGQTTQPIPLFDAGNPRSEQSIADGIQSALEALSNVGAGNVTAIVDSIARNNDIQNNVPRFSFEIRFGNDLARQDLPLLTVDGSSVVVNAGQTWDNSVNEVLDGDDTSLEAQARGVVFDDLYNFSRLSLLTPIGFDDLGAAAQTIPLPNAGEAKRLLTIPMVAVAPGVVNFTPAFPNNSPTTDIVSGTTTIPSDPNPGPEDPMSMVDFGAAFQVTVVADATAPVAVDDTLAVDENGSITLGVNVTANDTVTAPRTLSVQTVSAIGTTQGTVNGFTYEPPTDFVGSDTITYVAQDSTGLSSNTATVTINVLNVNDPPVADDDAFTVLDTDVNNTFNVLINDDVGVNDVGDTLTIIAASTTGTGTVSFTGGNDLTYTPAMDFVGVETLSYTVEDTGGLTSMASVTVEVVPAVLPTARNDNASTEENQSVDIDVLANDLANQGEESILLGLGSIDGVANGSVSINDKGTPDDYTDDTIVYTPNTDFNGTGVFTYSMYDTSFGNVSIGTVTVTVNDVNDVPELADDTVNATEDINATIASATLFANDSPGPGEGAGTQNPQTLTLSSVGNVTDGAGSVALNSNGDVIYTPSADYNGQFTFTYTAEDDGSPALSATATVTVNVAAVNDPPIATEDTLAGVEDTDLVIAEASILANDSPGPVNEAGQSLSVTSVASSSANGGTVAFANSEITYSPAANFNGQDSFTYTISDGDQSDIGTVTINVAPVNDPPLLVDDAASATAGVLLSIPTSTLLANDSGGPNEAGQTLALTGVSNASTGSVTLNGANVEVLAPADFSGELTFAYQAADDGSPVQSASAQVTVTVVAVQNSPPIAADDQVTATEDTPLSIATSDLLNNDSPGQNESAQTLSIVSLSGATLGMAVLDGSNIVYTPPADFSGTDSFVYLVTDDGNPALTDTATVTVSVAEVNDAPLLTDDIATTTQGLALTIPISTLLANDSPGLGETGQTLTLDSVTGPSDGGTVSIIGDNVVYTPDADFGGTFSFEYVASDDGTSSESATASVDIFVIASETPTTNVDLGITITESAPSVRTGQTLTYEILVTNFGTATASNVVVTSEVPADLSLLSVATSRGQTTQSDNVATVQVSTLPAGESVTMIVETRVVDASNGSVEKTVSVSAAEFESITSNNSAAVVTDLVIDLLSLRRLLAST